MGESTSLSDEGYIEEDATPNDNASAPKPTRRGRHHQPTQPPLDLAAISSIRLPDNTTHSSSYTNALAHHPVLHSSNIGSSASSAQARKSKSKRETSLAETYSELQLLNKLVTYGAMDTERDDLPDDIRMLIEDLQALCDNVGIIPSKIQVRCSTQRGYLG